MNSLRVIGVLLAMAACVALAGAALANKGSKPVRQLPHSSNVHKAKPLSKPARQIFRAPASSKTGQSADESDTDNIQSDDQTTPDQPDQSSEESQSENSGDNETGQPGEPSAGQSHEDPAGQDVNHECTGNCQE